jgi:hypothetical protein
VPPNSTAELYFDASVKQVMQKGETDVFDLNSTIKLESGRYEFVVK